MNLFLVYDFPKTNRKIKDILHMNIEETHQNVNEIYSNNFKRIIKGFDSNEMGENNKLKELSDYKKEDLPDESSWKHQKLRGFIKTDNALNSLVGKKIEYLFRADKNSNYAYCIIEL